MYEYDFNTYSIRRKKPKIRLYFSIIILILCTLSFFWFIGRGKSSNTQGNTQVNTHVLSEQSQQQVIEDNPLGLLVTQQLFGTEGSYAVGVKHFTKSDSYFSHEHVVYDAASLYKLWVMATAFEQIQQGNLKEDEVLEADIAELNKKFNISEDAAEMKEGEISLTVGSALKQMITISHNYAALLLTERLRLSTVKKFLEKNGFQESKVGVTGSPPTTTVADIVLFLEKLYQGKLADAEGTSRMVELLKGQQLNDKLPKYLPEETIIAHKTGELGFYSHDAGIVYSPGGEYIIVVLTKSKYPIGAEDRIGKVSKAVYDYFQE